MPVYSEYDSICSSRSRHVTDDYDPNAPSLLTLLPTRHSIKRSLRSKTFWQYVFFGFAVWIVFRLLRPAPAPRMKHDFQPYHVTQPTDKPDDGIDWTSFAYIQYVTDVEYLCNSLMMFEALHRLGSKADRVLLYPQVWELYPKKQTWQSMFLKQAQDEYKVHILPVRVQHFESGEGTWAESFTKLLAFQQTQYERVLNLDSDATILKPLDELFFLPKATIAAPQAYWLPENDTLSTAILLIEPSMAEYRRVLRSMYNRPSSDFYDMEIINDLYAGNASILPNKHWVVSGEFRRKTHKAYLSEGEIWDPQRVLNETMLVHFSDWPRPKPWLPVAEDILEKTTPTCNTMPGSAHKDCRDRDAWLWLYEDFAERRRQVCGTVFTLY